MRGRESELTRLSPAQRAALAHVKKVVHRGAAAAQLGDPQQQLLAPSIPHRDGHAEAGVWFSQLGREGRVASLHRLGASPKRDYEKELKLAAARHASQRAATVLDTYAVILPQRLVNEELGDFIEDINRRAAEGQGKARIYLRVAAAIFWTGWNAFGYITANLLGRKKGA